MAIAMILLAIAGLRDADLHRRNPLFGSEIAVLEGADNHDRNGRINA
jgi:hypothetical protein